MIIWDEKSSNFSTRLFDTTYWISYSIAPSSNFCSQSILDMYIYIYNQTQIYTDYLDFLASAGRNLLANVGVF
jgi:hypothetical protein